MKHDDELIQIFVEEANDILENVNSFFESWQNDLSQDEMLVAILRDLHTFKGSARMVGFTSLSECIHCLEQIIQKIHEGKIYSSGDIIEEIQFSLDFINSFIEAVAKAKSIPNTEVVLNRLKEITRSDQPEDPKTENQIDRVEIGTQPASDVVRVKADLLEEFSKLAGQVNVTRSHLEEQVGRVDDSLVEMAKEIKVIQEKMRNLQVKTDASLSLYHAAVTEKGNEEFDILELDRYSFLQEMTRMLIDKVNVLESLNSLNLSTMQNVEGLLVEQGRAARNLESGISHTRMISIEHLVPRLKRIVRQVSNELGKEVHLECIKAQGEVDRKILEKLIPALEHMVRNAIDHGIEPPNERARLGKHKHGVITLSLFRFGNEIVIQLGDDGKGIDIEKVKEKAIEKKLWDPQATFSKLDAIQMISLPGFSTKDVITPISGRGVGMDVVHAEVSKLGGTLEIESFSHQGTQFTIRVPFTLSLNQALILIAGTQHYAMLLSNLVAISRLSVNEIDKIMNEENHQINYAKQSYELFYLTELLNEKKWNIKDFDVNALPVIFMQFEFERIALVIDKLVGSREIVIKPAGVQLQFVKEISGISVLGDGQVILILNTQYLMQRALRKIHSVSHHVMNSKITVLIVDDSSTVRQVTSRLLTRNQYNCMSAKDGIEALSMLQEKLPDVVLLDIEMPQMDGFALLEKMRSDPKYKHIPVIMITSRAGEKHRARAMKAGANAYLSKPYREEELLTLLAKLNRSPHE